jgi:hypothetical protein
VHDRLPRRPIVARLFLAVALSSTGCKHPSDDAETTKPAETSAPKPTASAAPPKKSAQAVAAPKVKRLNDLERVLPPRPPGSLKALDNGPLKMGGDRPTLAIITVVTERLDKFSLEVIQLRFDESEAAEVNCHLAMDTAPSKLTAEESAAFEVCAGFKYVLFLRVKALKMPEDTSSGAFRPGFVEEDAFLYNVDTGAPLGGFSVKAKSSDHFKAEASETNPASKDLGWNLQDAIAARFEKLAKTDFPHAARPK